MNNPKLRQYELIRKLGDGSFGTSWLARDSESNREVVIKRFTSGLCNEESILNEVSNCKRIQWTLGEEINLVQLLGHVIDPDSKAGKLALVFEYCNSGTL